jgi:hypothetical protein
MSTKRMLLALFIDGGVATGAAFFRNSGSNAEDSGHIDGAQHMAGTAAEVPTMPGQEESLKTNLLWGRATLSRVAEAQP